MVVFHLAHLATDRLLELGVGLEGIGHHNIQDPQAPTYMAVSARVSVQGCCTDKALLTLQPPGPIKSGTVSAATSDSIVLILIFFFLSCH